jgi:transposase
MGYHSEAFVGIDTSKLRNAVAIADAGRGGEVRFLGEIENTPAATAKLVRKLSAKYKRLTFCYEAGPTGYGLHRQIKGLGFECTVVAPSLIPKRPGDKVKTNRRDALSLAKLLRADELTAVWVPDGRHEAMRDLTRARETAMLDLRTKRQHVSAFLLRLGRPYPESRKTWTKAHMSWIASQTLEQAQQRLVLEEMMLAIRQAQERLQRLEQAIAAAVGEWSLAPLVTALMAMRGLDLIAATTLLAEIGDLSRFRTPTELMAYLGLVPSEDSTGDAVKRGPITKAGNRRARRMLVECSWSYQHPPRVGQAKQPKVDAAPPAVREIAWKAQCRLYRRYRTLIRKGKLKTVAIVAIARELAGFVWAVARAVSAARVAAATA